MKRWAVRITSVIALLFLTSYALGSIDYGRVQARKIPWFTFNWEGFFDGGTFVGTGFGYSVVANHGVMYSQEHNKPGEKPYLAEGPELKFWFFPFLNKSEVKSSSEEFLR